MQEFTTFDMIIVGISVLLGLKGFFRGFIKEVFGLIGIIGAIFVASRMSDKVGEIIKPILGIQSEATLSLIGFIATLIGFWLLVYILGSILSKITEMSGLGVINRVLGFIFGTGKIFLIISVIVYALYQIESFKSTLEKKFEKSMVFPYLVQTGGYIVKLDTSKFTSSKKEEPKEEKTEPKSSVLEEVKPIAEKAEEKMETLGNTIGKATSEAVEKVKETTAEIIKENITNSTEKN